MNLKKLWKALAAIILTITMGALLTGCFGSSAKGKAEEGNQLMVHMLDIGQGDSFLLEKDGKFVLIDAGDIEHREALTKLLAQYHVKEISKVIISHPHEDHLGGMAAVFKNFKVDAVYDDGVIANTGSYRNYLKQIKEKNIAYKTVKAGDKISLFDGVDFFVYGPTVKMMDQKGKPDLNNNSVVGKLVYNKFSMIFTGDAEKEEEDAILKQNLDFKSDVLKVGHHGSRTSTSPEWLKAVAPKDALISLGKDNSYGHPHKITLQKLQKANVNVYRSDRDGTVTVTTNGADYKITKEH